MRKVFALCLFATVAFVGCDAVSSLPDDAASGREARSAADGLAAAKTAPSGSSTVVVTANDLGTDKAAEQADPTSWFFYNDQTDELDNSLGAFVSGPAQAPAGTGSATLTVTGQQRRNLATYLFSGVALADITALSFSTYNPAAGNGGSASRSAYLNFNVDFDGSDTWQRRLVFLPGQNGTVEQDTWQTWDAIDGGDARWTWSHFIGNGNKWPDGNEDRYRTWDDLVASFPQIAVRTTDAWLGLRVGEPYPNGYTEYVDAFVFGTADGTTTFDFEPLVGPPTDKDACKKGGWQAFNNPPFANQGQCIQHVNAGK